MRCDEGDDHFFIVYEAPLAVENEEKFIGSVAKFEKMPPIPMYLNASINWRQRSTPTKPLMMAMNVSSRLALHSRRDKEFHPAKLTEWVTQKEVFFIRCKGQSKFIPKTSYLCVYQPKGEATYVTGCKPNITNDDISRLMLFRLIKPKECDTETSTNTPTTSIPPFIIKVKLGNKSFFFKVSRNSKDHSVIIRETEDEGDATPFYLKVEKCNYFKILYKEKDDSYPYHLWFPERHFKTKGNWLKLSQREDAGAQSYMAFYASDMPSCSKRLHQRELVNLIEKSCVDKNDEKSVKIKCHSSVDSKDGCNLYVKKGDESKVFRVKTKRFKSKSNSDLSQNSTGNDQMTTESFMLLSIRNHSSTADSNQSHDDDLTGINSSSVGAPNQSQNSAGNNDSLIVDSNQSHGDDLASYSTGDPNESQNPVSNNCSSTSSTGYYSACSNLSSTGDPNQSGNNPSSAGDSNPSQNSDNKPSSADDPNQSQNSTSNNHSSTADSNQSHDAHFAGNNQDLNQSQNSADNRPSTRGSNQSQNIAGNNYFSTRDSNLSQNSASDPLSTGNPNQSQNSASNNRSSSGVPKQFLFLFFFSILFFIFIQFLQ